MKRLVSGVVLTIIMCVLAMYPSQSEAAIVYTSLDPKKCSKPSKPIAVAYDDQGLDVLECKAPAGWRVYTVVAGDRSWIDLQRHGNTWTTEDEVAYDQATRFGNFPNVGEGVMEWGVTSSESPSYVIFRVNAQDAREEASVGDVVSRLFVIDLKQGFPTFCGIARTNEEARALAAAGKCSKPIRKRTLN